MKKENNTESIYSYIVENHIILNGIAYEITGERKCKEPCEGCLIKNKECLNIITLPRLIANKKMLFRSTICTVAKTFILKEKDKKELLKLKLMGAVDIEVKIRDIKKYDFAKLIKKEKEE